MRRRGRRGLIRMHDKKAAVGRKSDKTRPGRDEEGNIRKQAGPPGHHGQALQPGQRRHHLRQRQQLQGLHRPAHILSDAHK